MKSLHTLLSAFIIVFMLNNEIIAQTFTKITDATNPIVNDTYQSGGGCWVDINNDGLLDLFVANGNLTNQQNSLYLNLGNGQFKKVTTGNIITDGGSSIGGTFGDFNNDGYLDLYVTNRNSFGNFLYTGTGDTIFNKVTSGAPVSLKANSNSSSWVDINNDGNLDLYTVNFTGKDFLFYNNGPSDFSFTSNTTANILNGNGFSIDGAWADVNNDGWPDLFQGYAGDTNDTLWVNNGNGTFTARVLKDEKSTLGASWGDFNNDGYEDLFVANYLDEGNILYRNSGPPDYNLVVDNTPHVTGDAGQSVGSCWGDFNNDGYLDLFVANDGEDNFLYINNGPPDYTFTKITTGAIVTDPGNSFGAVCGDYDNDGNLDIFAANHLGKKNSLYHNDGSSNHWVEFKLEGVTSNRSGIGAKVKVKATINGIPTWQLREVLSQTGYNSENLWPHFGLGNASTIDSVIIQWPSGATDVSVNLPANVRYTAQEGSVLTSAQQISFHSSNQIIAISKPFPNPFHDRATISYSLRQSIPLTVQLSDLQGRILKIIYSGPTSQGNHTVSIQATDLPAGIYFCRFTSGNLNENLKLFKY